MVLKVYQEEIGGWKYWEAHKFCIVPNNVEGGWNVEIYNRDGDVLYEGDFKGMWFNSTAYLMENGRTVDTFFSRKAIKDCGKGLESTN